MKTSEARGVFKRFGVISRKTSLDSLVDAVRLHDREMTAFRVEHDVNYKYRQTVVGTREHRDTLSRALHVLGWQQVILTPLKNPNDQKSRKQIVLTDLEHHAVRRAFANAPRVPFEGDTADHEEAGCGAGDCGACKEFRRARVVQKIDDSVARAKKKAGRSLTSSGRVTAHLILTVADWWELVEVLRYHEGPGSNIAYGLAKQIAQMFKWHIER